MLASRHEGLISRCGELKDYTSICASTPTECLGLMALRARHTLWGRANAIIEHNIALMNAFAAEHREYLEWRPPIAGPIAFPRLLLSGGAAQHCEALLRVRFQIIRNVYI